MKKSTVSNIRKKRIGRPPVNAVPVLVRIPPAEIEPIDAWIAKQKPSPSRPEAIRRLVEIGLTAHTPEPKAIERLRERVAGAAELAAKAVDGLTVRAPAASRKRRKAKGK